MNGNHSIEEWIYRPRWLQPHLAQAVQVHPVVVVTGARQVGKSTLLRHAPPMSGWRYRSLDDLDVLAQAERALEALWAGSNAVVVDDAHRAPKLFLAVKRAVDECRAMHFVLSGSANFLLLRRVSESLAGRAVYFVLRPMTWGEQVGRPPPKLLQDLLAGELPPEGGVKPAPDPILLILKGFLPPLMWLSSQEAATEWWRGYVMTYLERDLQALSHVASLADFRRVMELAALRTGQLVNQTELARDAGASQPTVHRYLNLLEVSFLIHRVPAFAKSKTKRLIKSPKLYWADPGLAAFLMGHYREESLRNSREVGALFENLVMLHLQVLADLLSPPGRIYHWRTISGEVDFVVEWGRRLVAVETKLATRARYADVRALELFLTQHEGCQAGILVYCGEETVRLGEKIIAVPWQALAGVG